MPGLGLGACYSLGADGGLGGSPSGRAVDGVAAPREGRLMGWQPWGGLLGLHYDATVFSGSATAAAVTASICAVAG